MRHRMFVITLAAAGLAFPQPSVVELNRGVVKITAHKADFGTETGAGLIVGIDGDTAIVVTAHHVIAEAKAIDVSLFQKQYAEYTAKPFRRFHEDLDLGLLTVALPHELATHLAQPFPIADAGDLREGDKLIVIGHPRGLEWQSSVNANAVTGLSEGEDSRKFRFTRTALAPGNSGGGVFKDDGSLLGLLTKLHTDYAVAVKVDALLFVLQQEWGIGSWWRSDDARAALARELAAHAVATRSDFGKLTADQGERYWWAFRLRDPDGRAPLERSTLLALESVKRSRTPEGEWALRDSLAWLPWPASRLSHYEVYAAFSPDGKYILSLSSREARVWNAATRRELVQIRLGDEAHAITLSHVGRYMATAGKQLVQIWRVPEGEPVANLPQTVQPNDEIYDVSFSPDDKLIAISNSRGKVARVWVLPAARYVADFEHIGRVRSADFSPNSQDLVTTSGADGTEEQKTVWVWNIASGRQKKRLDHRDKVSAVAFSPDGKYLVTADTGLLRIWNPSTYANVSEVQIGDVGDLRFSPDSRRLLAGWWRGGEKGVVLFEAGTWRILGSAGGGWLRASAFTANGTYAALLGFDNSCRVWNLDTGREIARLVNDEGNWPTVVAAFSPDGQYAITEGTGGYAPVKLWQLTVRDPVAAACARLRRNLTPDEWRRYLGREPYRRTCTNLP